MDNYIFDCTQALSTSLDQDDVLSRDIILTIVADMSMDVTEPDTGFPLNDRVPPLTEIEVEFFVSEVDDLNFTNDNSYYFHYFKFSQFKLFVRMYRKDSDNHLVMFDLPDSGKLSFLTDEQMNILLKDQPLKCIFKLDISNEVKTLSTTIDKNLSGDYKQINQLIQDILTYKYELDMTLAELQISPSWNSGKWKYELWLWIPTKDGESDSLGELYDFDELNVLQELFGREFIWIRTISRMEFKFKLDTTS